LKRTLEGAKRIGLKTDNIQIDIEKLLKHKNDTVKRLTGGVKLLLEKAGVKIFYGSASFISDKEIEIVGGEGKTVIQSDNFLIATGAAPLELPILKYDGERIIGAREAIDIPIIPEKMLIVGAGPIGLEMT